MATVSEIIEHLNNLYQPDEHIAANIWCEGDVEDRAGELGIKVSKKKVQEIIDAIHVKQDCTIGISWDTLDVYIEELSKSPDRD